MFGYIRPLSGELKVKELEAYKACYCGLCHTLSRDFGFIARFILNYDFVLLVMLLWHPEEKPTYEKLRCIAHPCRRRMCCFGSSMKRSAAMSIILAWWKLADDMADGGFVKSLLARLEMFLLRRAYRKAKEFLPDFDEKVKDRLSHLSQLEKAGEKSLDRVADCFAQVLSSASEYATDDLTKRCLEQILYQTGRYIYIIDACDDAEKDIKEQNYNPVITAGAPLTADEKEYLKTTIIHSRNLVGAAFELLPVNPWSEIVRNIIFYGMPAVCDAVLNGTFKHKKTRSNL